MSIVSRAGGAVRRGVAGGVKNYGAKLVQPYERAGREVSRVAQRVYHSKGAKNVAADAVSIVGGPAGAIFEAKHGKTEHARAFGRHTAEVHAYVLEAAGIVLGSAFGGIIGGAIAGATTDANRVELEGIIRDRSRNRTDLKQANLRGGIIGGAYGAAYSVAPAVIDGGIADVGGAGGIAGTGITTGDVTAGLGAAGAGLNLLNKAAGIAKGFGQGSNSGGSSGGGGGGGSTSETTNTVTTENADGGGFGPFVVVGILALVAWASLKG